MTAVVGFLAIAVLSHNIPLTEKEKASGDCAIAIVTQSAVAYKSHNTSVHITSRCILAVTFHVCSPSLKSRNQLQNTYEFPVLCLREMVNYLKGIFSILFSVSDNLFSEI